MLRIVVLFLFLISAIFLSQTQLRVLGSTQSITRSESLYYKLRLKNDTITLQNLNDALKANDVDFELQNDVKTIQNNPLYKTYILVVPNKNNNYQNTQKVIESLLIEILQRHYNYNKSSFEDEDEKAILALKDAIEKAKILAEKYNYEILNIANIDDLSSPNAKDLYEEMFPEKEIDDRKIDVVMEFLEKISEIEIKNNEEIASLYTIWVTFNIKAIN